MGYRDTIRTVGKEIPRNSDLSGVVHLSNETLQSLRLPSYITYQRDGNVSSFVGRNDPHP